MPSASLLDKVLENPAVKSLFDQAFEKATETFNDRLDLMGQKMERYLIMLAASQQGKAAAQQKKDDPKVILGFGPDEALTKDKIKTRQRFLAGEYHPDKGGSTEARQRVNDAAEELLKTV